MADRLTPEREAEIRDALLNKFHPSGPNGHTRMGQALIEEICILRADNKRLREALSGIMRQIEIGVLVRNTAEDGKPEWAIKQLPLVMAIEKCQAILEEKSA